MKFYVTGRLTITVTTIIEAPNEAAARAIASERSISGNWQDSGNTREEWVHDELDGEPIVVSVTPSKGRG